MTDDSSTFALVTGANRGIGFAIARQLAERGLTVLVAARSPERAAAAAERLRAAGAAARPLTLDVTDPSGVREAARQVDAWFGRLDVLVNNAGISGAVDRRPPSAATPEEVGAVLGTNVLGVLAVTNAMLPLLRRSARARIVNVSSGLGSLDRQTDPGHYVSGLPPMAAYPVSKAALNMLTVQYARELRPEGILVNAAAPGACATDFTSGLPFARGVTRTADEGAAVAVRLATLGPDGPTGGFFEDDGPVRW
ncbi:dehydrogenase [Kitasatospora phosalacinea]|uniref:Dehydrogenase n=1 Tax=Kitasatospora phosalacinea TaxID=2065 RepID=A0A9W6Q214_9ACTN|nr:SDR family NAD(P)-dependent oxidoreductase [Kitasatospora phosalacinea]GLW68580.1 dehydrogenase [Kitasatospora phosalacinea]